MESAFVFLTLDEARAFRQQNSGQGGFGQHLLYRVSLSDPTALSHVTDSRLCVPQGAFRHDWADVYWMDFDAQAAAIPGIDWLAVTNRVPLREMLTLSQLVIEERLD